MDFEALCDLKKETSMGPSVHSLEGKYANVIAMEKVISKSATGPKILDTRSCLTPL